MANKSATPPVQGQSDQNQSDQNPAQGQGDKVHGEGNYEATRQYDEATKKFIESGRVDEAAQKAKPSSAREAKELDDAERAGKSRAKEEDPALYRPGKARDDDSDKSA